MYKDLIHILKKKLYFLLICCWKIAELLIYYLKKKTLLELWVLKSSQQVSNSKTYFLKNFLNYDVKSKKSPLPMPLMYIKFIPKPLSESRIDNYTVNLVKKGNLSITKSCLKRMPYNMNRLLKLDILVKPRNFLKSICFSGALGFCFYW